VSHLTRQDRTQLLQSVAFTAGTGKSHTLIGLGTAAIHAGHKVRYFTAADLVETLYRGLADNTVGKIVEFLLRVDLIILDELRFAPLDDTGTQLLFRLVAGAYERRSLAIGSHWPSSNGADSYPSRPPRSASSTACCTTPPSSSPTVTPTA
jgi:DNA replication protein DnaC